MPPIADICFGVFTLFTICFAGSLLVALCLSLRPTKTVNPTLAPHLEALQKVGSAPDAAPQIKDIADASVAVIQAAGDFGSKLETFGPTTILAVFTAIFSVLMLLSAWIARPTPTS